METLEKDFLKMLHDSEAIIFRVCLMFTSRHTEEMNDLYQEIVLNAWDGYRRFRSKSSFTTWIYRVALNTAVNCVRSTRRKPLITVLDESIYNNLAESAGDVLVERLYELIDRLGAEDKKLIFLYLDSVPIRQIAQIAGRPESTVKKHLKRIKQELIRLNENE